jgi:CheY-like chemotaxis protein
MGRTGAAGGDEMDLQQDGPRALVVDDDDALLRVHARILSAHGYRVETAHNGSDALRALALTSFDVILSDIDMPTMNGMQLLESEALPSMRAPSVAASETADGGGWGG